MSIVTLGVADVERARSFYERLGWRGHTVEATVFFQAGGMALVLWGRGDLASDSGIVDREVDGFSGIALAQNVRSRAEVDAVISSAEEAGAVVTRRPAETFYDGYAGYFIDLVGHAWEIAYNPGFTLEEDGSLTIPDLSNQ